ncbi:histidine kinase [Allokutzneria sp. A3M-2-11 16]|uniref:sensor histidine kinase n=1 Tax=Allokutzneria sp. A3M-2-11 16 TaxID=2962043 RepID=UPI0020B8943F|nr:histidine kinase [Allokutzneria sp. A3M-2-11 16]MCP3802016.1 histidine kinase [Allokutzneria sp. A3M-2-11 16]
MPGSLRPAAPPLDRWMLPGELVRAAAADPRDPDLRSRLAPRTVRDWAVDVAVLVVAVVGFVVGLSVLEAAHDLPAWLRIADPILGVVACVALWWRRRFPAILGVVTAVVASISNTAVGAVAVLLFSVALHRGWRWAVPIAAGAALLAAPYVFTLYPATVGAQALWVVTLTLAMLLVLATGLGVRARRQLVLALRAGADASRREYEQQLEESRRSERMRIAREMHDVLAHRLSLLSVHAGALEYRTATAETGAAPVMTAAEVHRAASVVRSNAHQALEELGDVLRLLRHSEATEDTEREEVRPLPALLEEARLGGQPVRAEISARLAEMRLPLQRTVYRLVQEGLTNARKHAPGAQVEVLVRDDPGREILVQVSNPAPVGVTISDVPGCGAGLIGLGERVALHGGQLTREVSYGHFRLRARMPWPS